VAHPSAAASATNALRPFIVLGGLVLAVAFLYFAKVVLVPLALATLLAFIMTPLVNGLQRRGLRRIPSAILVVALAFVLLAGVGYVIWAQVGNLLNNLPRYQNNIRDKVAALNLGGGGMWNNVRRTLDIVTGEGTDGSPPDNPQQSADDWQRGEKPREEPLGSSPKNPMYVYIAPSGYSRAAEAAGPAAEFLAQTFLVVVMVVFMLVQRENLRNRVVRLIGHGRLIATTRAIDEAARRVSGYLLMQMVINVAFGFTLAACLFALSFFAPDDVSRHALRAYAVLWGFVAAALRFVPYLGTWLAAALLVAFSVATITGWTLPLVIFGVFVGLELLTANVLEPLLFGHSTGVTPLALLLAAAFWTWLWGPIGLLLSTPMTVMAVVLGKYVPQLQFLEVLLGDEEPLSPRVVFYQRLLARDQDEASDLIDEYLQTHAPEDAYQEVLLPALSRVKQDRERGELDDDDVRYLTRATRDVVEEVAAVQHERTPSRPAPAPPRPAVLCCPARDEADELALDMFRDLLRAQGYEAEVVPSGVLTAEVLTKVGELCPAVVCVAALPPGGLAQARYLCKRIKSQCKGVKVAVGRWGQQDNAERVQGRLKGAGADLVGFSLAETRAQVVPLLQLATAADGSGRAGAPAGELAASR
jgi:predicted PurR-regulated permease PerM